MSVVKRLLLDWRHERYGKWRPSSFARRFGGLAVDLDRLMSRDGYGPDEAVVILEGRSDAPCAAVLRELASQLPRHTAIRTVLADDMEALLVSRFEDPIEARQTAITRRRTMRTLRRAYRRLSPEDRQILSLCFERNMSIAAIATLLGVPAKPLYRRMYKLFRVFRRELLISGDGVSRQQRGN